MKHRISAGLLVEHERRVLMVRHLRPGSYDFWVAPGGGVEGTETLAHAACREVRWPIGTGPTGRRATPRLRCSACG